MSDRHGFDERTAAEERRRRRLLATLTVVLPILAGIVIAVGGHFASGKGPEIETPAGERRRQAPRHLVEAATPAEAGTPAPRVRLTEAATGRPFDSPDLGDTPFAVVFVSTHCQAIGGFLTRAARRLAGVGTILVISADPRVDSPRAVREWLTEHHVKERDPLHYLTGNTGELRRYWSAWGFRGPTSACPRSVPAHLVRSSKGTYINTGILDIDPSGPADILTLPLRALAH